MITNAAIRRREKHKVRIKFLKIKNLTIEPQAFSKGGYWFDGSEPVRIGDQARICFPATDWRVGVRRVKVILLADESGRQWLVACS